MNKNQFPGYVLGIMKNLNMLIILYISGVTARSLFGYIHENSAMDFLMKAGHMPMEPWKIPILAVGLYICLLLLLSIRCRNNPSFLLKTAMELGVAFGISYVLNFSYTGIVLLIIADTMGYFTDTKRRIILVTSICAVYMILDYNL